MAYPLFLIVLMFIAFSIVTFVLVPAIEPAFENTGKLPPLAIRVFSSIRAIFTTGLPVLVSTLSFVAMTFAFSRVRKYWGSAILSLATKAPLIGKQMWDQQTAAYLNSLSLLLENGVALSRSLELANASVTQPLLHEKFESVRKIVTGGTRISDAFAKLNIFDDRIVSVLSVGFEAGKLAFATGQCAIMLEERARKRMEVFLAILTPAITIFIGATIGGLILSVMSALLSVNELAIQ
jgi:general secretion pathway protein F